MIGRREERRKIALEEIERRNNIKNKKEKKRRSKSKDRGLPRIEGKKAVRKLMNSFLGKDHKNNLFGVKAELQRRFFEDFWGGPLILDPLFCSYFCSK